jgi:hypothetical protein
MTIQLACVVFDCSDAQAVGQFWSEALVALSTRAQVASSQASASLHVATRRAGVPSNARTTRPGYSPACPNQSGQKSGSSGPHRQ